MLCRRFYQLGCPCIALVLLIAGRTSGVGYYGAGDARRAVSAASSGTIIHSTMHYPGRALLGAISLSNRQETGQNDK